MLRRVCFCDSIQTLIPIIYSAVTRDFLLWFSIFLWDTEAVVWRCSVKKVFLEISQNSQENTCAGDSFLMELQASHLLEPHLYDKACTATFHLISYWILLLLSLCVWTVQYQLNTFDSKQFDMVVKPSFELSIWCSIVEFTFASGSNFCFVNNVFG